MLISSILASLLLAAQPLAAEEQRGFTRCLDSFLAGQQQQRPEVEEFTSALASACALEEHAFRRAYVDRAAAAGTPYLTADAAAFDTILDLRTRYRSAFLATQQGCAGDR